MSDITENDIQEAIDSTETLRQAADKLGISTRHLRRLRARHAQETTATISEIEEEHRLQRTVTELRRKIRILLAERGDDTEWSQFVRSFDDLPRKDLEWLVSPPTSSRRASTPVAFFSDFHYCEVVDPACVDGLNAYNSEIATLRAQRFFQNVPHLAKKHLAGIDYNGIALLLGGDLTSGNIHEEISETNDRTGLMAVLEVCDILKQGISYLADEFGRVHVCSVVGNHGRLTRKPPSKKAVEKNTDWLITKILERDFAGAENVSFNIPSHLDCRFTLGKTDYVLTHGDQFRGGNGIAGIASPLMLGDARKRKNAQATDRSYDVLVMGHWHQLCLGMMSDAIIVNGSLKGYDEYAVMKNLPFDKPQQALWINHPEHGITLRAPVRCRADEEVW